VASIPASNNSVNGVSVFIPTVERAAARRSIHDSHIHSQISEPSMVMKDGTSPGFLMSIGFD